MGLENLAGFYGNVILLVDTLRQRLADTVKSFKAEVNRLTDSNKDLKTEVVSLTEQNGLLKETQQGLKAINEDSGTTAGTLKTDLALQTQLHQETQTALEAAKNKLTSTEESLAVQLTAVTKLARDLAAKTTEWEMLKAFCTTLQANIEEMSKLILDGNAEKREAFIKKWMNF